MKCVLGSWLSVASLCGAAEAQTDPQPSVAEQHDIRSIIKSGVLRVAMTEFDMPPFHQKRANGVIVGREAELAHQIARFLGVKATFIDKAETSNAVVQLVAEGSADIGLSAIPQTFERVTAVRFSAPYITFRHAILFNRKAIAAEANGGPPVDVLRDFRGSIGVVWASAFVGFADRNFPLASVVEYKTRKEAIEGLQEGSIAAVYDNEFEARRIFKDDPSFHINYGVAVMSDRVASIAIAICDTCSKLQEFINFFISENKSTFRLEQPTARERTR